jgi:glycosyltransferase involved in cell wall biosynthesis
MSHSAEHSGVHGQRLSVIIISDSAAVTGGAERVPLMEATNLARRGHRVTLITGHGEPDPELGEAGVTVHTTDQHTTLADPNRARAAAQGIWNRGAAALVRKVTAGADPANTVVHVHGFTKVLSASAVRAARESGLKTIATLHEYFAACPNGGFFNYQTKEICRLTPLSARCVMTNCDARSYAHKVWRVGRTAVQWRVGAMPSGLRWFITPSQFAADILRPYLPADANLHVLPNPIAFPKLPAVDVAANSPFVFVGRLDPDKGPLLLAEAARRAGVSALFVGAGEEAASIRATYSDAQLTGWLDPDGVRSALRSARAIVNPSLWYETQGLSALEAAALGVPAIVSDATALTEVVSNDGNGLWFRGGDVDDLAEKLGTVQKDDALVARLGREAHERFWAGSWDVSTHLDRLEDIYRAVIRG